MAAAAGALSGVVGAAVIVPLAAAAGAATLSGLGAAPVIASGTELVTGMTMSAGSNILISSGQRTVNQVLEEGKALSLDTYKANIQENYLTDAAFGGFSYMSGSAISNAINYMFPIIPKNIAPINGMNSGSGQKVVIGGMQAAGQAITNSTLMDGIHTIIKKAISN